ncbi:hypothetical protein A3Q32_09975 [Alcanivorax sp. KX64203]|nr:hypothetical protein A3Q32_09975 [Alcanivorax sp. KX64203]
MDVSNIALLTCLPQIILNLLAKPCFSTRSTLRAAEPDLKATGQLDGNGSLAVENTRQSYPGYAELASRFTDAEPQSREYILTQGFSGVGRIEHLHSDLLMVVLIIHENGIAVLECESESPVAIHPYGIVTGQITF